MGVKENPNRKVRCVETGKFYVSIRRRGHARYRSWWFSHSEYHIEIAKAAQELSVTPEANAKRSATCKQRFKDNPEIVEQRRQRLKRCWDDQEYVDNFMPIIDYMGSKINSDMHKCLGREASMLKDGKPVVRFEKGRRRRSVGVVQL